MSPDRGFVLVNALVLVAALAAVAVFLLARADAGRARLDSGLGAEQVALNLDAFEALAVTLLSSDTGTIDHAGEAWARASYDVPLERGRVAGQISDLQGLFNLNWLTDPSNVTAEAAFERLLEQLGLSAQTGQVIRQILRPEGPADPGAWARRTPPERPVGGPFLMADQLAHIPGLEPRVLARLRPFVAALPGDSTLNVNTMPAEVLTAFLPDLPAAARNKVLRDRTRTPFVSVDEFLLAVGVALPDEDDPEAPPAELPPEMLSVGSAWFRAEIRATLDNQTGRRSVVLHRQGLPAQIDTAWRITVRP